MIIIHKKQKIELRMLLPHDASSLFDLVDNNRFYLREWLPWLDANRKRDDSLVFINLCKLEKEANKGEVYGILQSKKLIGMCGFNKIDISLRHGYIGYWLKASLQGQGITKACVKRVITYGFNELKLTKIVIAVAQNNIKSRSIPESLGFTFEKVVNNAEFLYDHYVNHIHYSLTVKDWII